MHTVTFQPLGRRVDVASGATLLDAAQAAGVGLIAVCGGGGTCGTCRVRPVSEMVSPPNALERSELSPEELVAGLRLACQTHVLGNVLVEIPPESLTTPQRLQLEGVDAGARLEPPVAAFDLRLSPPALDDLRDDLGRVEASLAMHAHVATAPLEVAAVAPQILRKAGWHVRVVLSDDKITALLPAGTRLYGLAIDIGTTKLAAYLVNLETAATVARAGAMNPQIAYGEDVIRRIAFAGTHVEGGRILQSALVEALNALVRELCLPEKIDPRSVVAAVAVGNTAMHHLFAGLPVRQLGESPYVPAVSRALEFPATAVGLQLAAGARVYMPPNIAGYVGSDHVAMLLGAGLETTDHTTLAIDIGTNAEISLLYGGRHWSCSCASGPAFEGAHIRDGMRAAPGAIEHVRITPAGVDVQTVNRQLPAGICGSGVLDAVAELHHSGLLDPRGSLRGTHPQLQAGRGTAEFVLVPADRSATGRPIGITRHDVNEVQLAKAAIRVGIDTLLFEAGISADDIEEFVVAGAFGTYLDVDSAVRIGMFPSIPRASFRQVGNAAGGGARRLLICTPQRRTADELAHRVEYVELATHPGFSGRYAKALAFP